MVSVVTITCTGSIVVMALAAATLDVVVAGVVLQMAISAGDRNTSERGLLLKGSSLVKEARFRFWC